MKKLVIFAAVLALAAPAAFAAKEKANRTKCKNAVKRVGNIGSSGCDGVRQIASDGLADVKELLAVGEDEEARKVGTKAVRRLRHRGHVTVLKLHATTNGCTGQAARSSGIDPKLVEEVEDARDAAIEAVEAEVVKAVAAFGDIFGDPDFP